MKKSTQSLKLRLAGRYAMAVCFFCATTTNVLAQDMNETLRNFFSTRLGGGEEAFAENVPLELDEIETQQANVWQAWVKANEGLEEEVLIPLENLSKKKIIRVFFLKHSLGKYSIFNIIFLFIQLSSSVKRSYR